MHRSCCTVLLALAGAACTGEIPVADAIERQYAESGRRVVDLDRAVPRPWQRVCVIAPYMDNDATRATLGFAWDSEKVSDIAMDEGKVLLVFVGDTNQVAFHAPYRRTDGDFSNLGGQCFTRAQARFTYVARPAHGWAGLFPVQPMPAAPAS